MTSAKNRLSCAVGIRLACSAAARSTRSSSLIDAVAALRRDHRRRRPAQEVKRVGRQIAQRRPSLRVAGDEIALVERDHERAAGLLDLAGDPRVLLGGPDAGVDHEHRDVGALDLAERHRRPRSSRCRRRSSPCAGCPRCRPARSRGRRSRTACRPDRSSCRRRGGRASAPRRAAGSSATTCRRWAGRRTRRAAGRGSRSALRARARRARLGRTADRAPARARAPVRRRPRRVIASSNASMPRPCDADTGYIADSPSS